MKSVIFMGAIIALTLTGCTSLTDKAVIVDSSVQGFKVTTGADTTSGTPLPNISAGWGKSLLVTMPTDKPGTLEYENASGSLFGKIFGIEVTDKTSIRITAADSAVKVETKTDASKTVTTTAGGGKITVSVQPDTVVSTGTAASEADLKK